MGCIPNALQSPGTREKKMTILHHLNVSWVYDSAKIKITMLEGAKTEHLLPLISQKSLEAKF